MFGLEEFRGIEYVQAKLTSIQQYINTAEAEVYLEPTIIGLKIMILSDSSKVPSTWYARRHLCVCSYFTQPIKNPKVAECLFSTHHSREALISI